MPGSMSEFPDSFEPLDLPVVPDVPRSGTDHGGPGPVFGELNGGGPTGGR